MRTVPCPDCGLPAVETGRFTVDGVEYVRLRCGSAPALLLPAAGLIRALPGPPARRRPAAG